MSACDTSHSNQISPKLAVAVLKPPTQPRTLLYSVVLLINNYIGVPGKSCLTGGKTLKETIYHDVLVGHCVM